MRPRTLKGSLTEEKVRVRLLATSRDLAESPAHGRIRAALAREFPGHRTAHVIRCVPEQDADILTILVDGQTVVSVECARSDPKMEPTIVARPVSEYAHDLRGRQDQLVLAIAIDLAGQG